MVPDLDVFVYGVSNGGKTPTPSGIGLRRTDRCLAAHISRWGSSRESCAGTRSFMETCSHAKVDSSA